MNLKNLAMWGVIVFLTIGLYNMFKNPQSNVRGGNQIIFSEFLTSVENGEVLKVEIQGNNIKGVFSNGNACSTYSPNDPNLIEKLSTTLEVTSRKTDDLIDTIDLNDEILSISADNSLVLTTSDNYSGNTVVSIAASDGNLNSEPIQFVFTVENINDTPVLDSISNPSQVDEDGDNISISIFPTDADGDNLVVTALSSNPSLISDLSLLEYADTNTDLLRFLFCLFSISLPFVFFKSILISNYINNSKSASVNPVFLQAHLRITR